MTKPLKPIIALMLVLFIDGMGQGIIFPILANSITDPSSTLFFHHASMTVRHIWYGTLIGAYYLMWFLAAPLLGEWSDAIGRKKPLLICLGLIAVSFLLSALAFSLNSIGLLFFARLLGGTTSGDQAIAKAAVIDIAPKHHKPIYLGLVLCAITLGLVFGPLMGAVLQNSALVSWFNIKTPFYFACLLALFNMVLLIFTFNETIIAPQKIKLPWTRVVHLIGEAFVYPPTRVLFIGYCLTQTAWQIFYMHLQNYVMQRFAASTTVASSILSSVGLGIGLGLNILPILFKRFDHKRTAIMGYCSLGMGLIIILLLHHARQLYWVIVPMSALFGLSIVNILTLFSHLTPENRQGWIMGATGSVVALTGALGALLAGLFAGISLMAPYVFALGILLVGILLLIKSQTKL